MHTALRPWITSGIALVGASVIAVAPIAPPPPMEVPDVHPRTLQLPQVQLTASVIEIFTFPAFRQYILNQVLYYGTWAAGLAGAGVGLGEAIGALPESVVQLTQQLLSLDLQGALTTIETYLVGAIAAVGLPLLDSIITNRERRLAIQLALQSAVPEAIIGAGAAIFAAIDGVLRASIEGGQEVVDAILTLNLGNIVNALVNATSGFFGSFVEGGQDIVDGIVFAQQTIADALATPPPAVATATAADVTSLPNPDDNGFAAFTLSTDSDVDEQDSADSASTDTTETELEVDEAIEDEDEDTAADDEEAAEDESESAPEPAEEDSNPAPDAESDDDADATENVESDHDDQESADAESNDADNGAADAA